MQGSFPARPPITMAPFAPVRPLRRWWLGAALLALVACSKDKDIDKPSPLPLFNANVHVEKLWSASVADKGGKPLRLGLGLAVEEQRVYAAGHSGEVAAFDLVSGHTRWHVRTKLPLSGGPGVGGGLVTVGSSTGDVIALGTPDGAVRWHVHVNGEVLAAPAVSERLVAVRTVDGKMHGLDPKDGRELWVQEEQVPRLSLRGTAWPVLTGDLVLSGFDDGKVAAINVNDGSIQWETTIAPAHGRTEIERLDDVDEGVRVSGSDVYAVGFQGRIAMLALDNGQIWWSHDASSYRGLGLDAGSLYVSMADGEVVALRRRTGTELWRQKALQYRRLSAAVESDAGIVTADYQGYVHWLDKATGNIVARASSGKVRVSNAPIAVGNMVLVVNDAGDISAFRATLMTPAKAAAAPELGAPLGPTPSGPTTLGPAAPAIPAASPAPGAQPGGEPASVPQSPAPGGSPEPQAAPPPALPPGTPPAPLPSQPTPDPTPPMPQTKPQPPPT
ncbi:MAG TPA: outer membrane protein assembly factor BamB [Steroidobacteraceae bacterium]